MKITTVLFDLDGTLLPMDQDDFVNRYFKNLATFMAPHGYDPEMLVKGVWAGTLAMMHNNGNATNETVFWQAFAALNKQDARDDEPIFAQFYENEFDKARSACGFTPRAGEIVSRLKAAGKRIALATNPIFPAVATDKRIKWAGLDKNSFELVTTYENSRHCKPDPAYFRDLLASLGVTAEECLMVGNDATEDMVAKTLGMKVFLLTDCLINKENKDITVYPHGDFDALCAFLQNA